MADRYSREFIERTKQVWQSHTPHPLTDEDAGEIADNLTALFMLLAELDEKYGPL